MQPPPRLGASVRESLLRLLLSLPARGCARRASCRRARAAPATHLPPPTLSASLTTAAGMFKKFAYRGVDLDKLLDMSAADVRR
jgi:hypothetical protein